MLDDATLGDPGFQEAYAAHLRQERLNTGRVAAALVVFLMPVGVVLDFFMYSDRIGLFLLLRMICSLLAAGIWFLHTIPFGRRHYRYLSLPIAFLPAFFISLMIYDKEGSISPYYAGLNLILLAVSAVVHWSTRESVIAVSGVIGMYLAAVFAAPSNLHTGMFANNLYFLGLTGIIVVTGNFFFNRLRFREFALRYELDRNRQKLEETNQKLVELDEAKSRFFANISHELRTPLTLLLAPLETIRQRAAGSLEAGSRQLLETMHANGMRLLKLINDLLDLVRLESGRMEARREPLALEEFVKGLASAVRQVAEDKRIRLETDVAQDLPVMLVDRDKLEKVLLNLLFNALKFTPGGGRVRLTARRRNDQLELVVEDSGMGIAEKNLPFIFDRFWQADGSSKRKYQGVGIGLALVKELVEVQGGTVHVESEEGEGTLFTILIPFLQADVAEERSAAEGAGEENEEENQIQVGSSGVQSEEWLTNLYRRAELFPSMTPVQEALRPQETIRQDGKPKLLVADDEPDMLRFLRSQLSDQYQVLEAVDGAQAVAKAIQFLPDIILLDMMMPEKDGLQACRELRQKASTLGLPIVLLTARADEETKLAALSAGASDFLSKPFSTTELHVRVRNLVESHQYQQKVSRQNQVLESTIEQLKETELQLVQVEKMASLGRLSAGIIHEINNPLNFATTGLYTLRKQGQLLKDDDRAEFDEILRDVEEGVSRVKEIVSGLRSFSHPETEQLDQVSVAEVVESCLRFLGHEQGDRVAVETVIPAELTVWANKNKLIQVLLNLLQNSFDALKQKVFSDSTRPTIHVGGERRGSSGFITIRDNGTGIDKEHVGKIFDPFYTTKDVGEGMGLGLSICYRILEEFGARIWVETEAGAFSKFTLEFFDPPPGEH